MDDQPVAEGLAGLLAEFRILDAAPTGVVARGSHSRWIGSGDWVILLAVKDGDTLPVPDGEASGRGSRSTGASGRSSIRHPACASGCGNPKSMGRRTSIENARNATAGDPNLRSNWSLPRREV